MITRTTAAFFVGAFLAGTTHALTFQFDPTNTYVTAIISFGVDALDYNRLADQMETTPADAMQRVEFILANYKAAADMAVKGIVGSDTSEFHEWAATEATKDQQQAMLQLVLGGNSAAMTTKVATYDPLDAELDDLFSGDEGEP